MNSQNKKDFSNVLVALISFFRIKIYIMSAGFFMIFSSFQSSYCLDQETSQEYDRPSGGHYQTPIYKQCSYYNENEGGFDTFIPSQRTREVLGLSAKAGLTTIIDHQLEEYFSTKNESGIVWSNIAQRIVYKSLIHGTFNIVLDILETGTKPTQNQIQIMLCKTLIDVTISELVHGFIPLDQKHGVRAILHGIIHGLFQISHTQSVGLYNNPNYRLNFS